MTDRNKLNTVDHHSHHEHEVEEEELFDALPAIIFDAAYCGEEVPKGFDAVRIVLDGKIKADLSWKNEQHIAEGYVKQGLRIFWEIDLGLPSSLNHALSNRTQFLSLSLSLEHFRDTLWKKFRKETVGLGLYRGSLDFSLNYPWDDEQERNLQDWIKDDSTGFESFIKDISNETRDIAQLTSKRLQTSLVGKNALRLFCCDAIGEYLNLLASRVPDNLPLFLLFNASEIQDAFLVAQLLSKERYPRFHVAVKNDENLLQNQILGGELSWSGEATEKGTICRILKSSPFIEKPKLGFCLPQISHCQINLSMKLKKALGVLLVYHTPFRVIPEVEFSIEWEGLDYLIVDSQFVEVQFKRRLQGFCAAGGTAVVLGKPLGLAEEISFDEFLNMQGIT